MKPRGVEVLSHDDGLILFVPTGKSWWQFWWPNQVTHVFARDGVIWLRQVIFKIMQEKVQEGEHTEQDELTNDVQRALQSVNQAVSCNATFDLNYVKQIADLMWQKGYRK